jgi:hypothetical protein
MGHLHLNSVVHMSAIETSFIITLIREGDNYQVFPQFRTSSMISDMTRNTRPSPSCVLNYNSRTQYKKSRWLPLHSNRVPDPETLLHAREHHAYDAKRRRRKQLVLYRGTSRRRL